MLIRAVSAALVLTGLVVAGSMAATAAPRLHWLMDSGYAGDIPQDTSEAPLGDNNWGDDTYLFGEGFNNDLVVDHSEPVHHDGRLRLTSKQATGQLEYHPVPQTAFSSFTGSYWVRSRSGLRRVTP